MAAPLYGSKEYIDYFFTNDVGVELRPDAWEIALHTGDPGTGDDNEVSEVGYVRQDVTFEAYDAPVQAVGGPAVTARYREAQSIEDVIFPEGEAGQDYKVTHYTIRDKTSGGALAIATLAVPIPVKEGTVISFPANYIKVRGV